MNRILVVWMFLSVAIVSGSVAQESNWPQWRGPDRNGVSQEEGLPLEWSSTKNVLWKTPVDGRGHSSPVVWGNRIFVTTDVQGDVIPGAEAVRHVRGGEIYYHPQTESADKRHTLKVLSLDADTGEILWTRTVHDGRVFDNRHRRNTYASPTVVTDGHHVYVYFGSQGVYCFDFEGNRVWTIDLGVILTWGHGHGASPLLYEDLLILQCDQDEGDRSFLVALDKATGREVWRTYRNTRLNYSSPILVETASRIELITSSYHLVVSYDPATGEELWRSEGFLGNAIPTPVANEKTVFVASGYPDKLTKAIAFPAISQKSAPTVLWEYRKGAGYVPSPLLYKGYLYLVSDKGVLTCLDAETGDVVYEGGRIPTPTSVRASPVAWDGKILLSGENGDYFVVEAGPVHKILSVNSIGETVYASPAITKGRLFLRSEGHLYAIGASPGNAR